MRNAEIDIEPTPQAVARIRHWIVLLAADETAPTWNPVEDYRTPATLRAAARWLVDNGHAGTLDFELVGVLLALFSVTLRSEMALWELPRDAA
jgi:plasmid stabilization system protein ParE